jgi:UDP-glucose 4-epimerase
MSIVIVTGSAGYIGGQTMLTLKDAGHEVYGIDCRQPPAHLRGVPDGFLYQDFASDVALSWIIQKQPNAIIHCAGTSLVGPSVKNPSEYYNNNVAKTLKLLDIVKQSMPRCKLVFSSSAATYGEPIMNPIHEVDPKEPVSPYGESKLMIDMMLESYHRAYGVDYVSFRYFNACGADPKGRHGQEPGATHIIARVLESIRDQKDFVLNGNDFPTEDGTCVRDYVHVDDIARAHALALYHKIPAGVYNLGSSMGTSNQGIIEAALDETQQPLNVVVGKRRAGDPPVLTASSEKFNLIAGAWRHYTLDAMIQHAWAWYVRQDKKV